jgi:hypothetical protein
MDRLHGTPDPLAPSRASITMTNPPSSTFAAAFSAE